MSDLPVYGENAQNPYEEETITIAGVEPPSSWLWLAIISLIGFLPLSIYAVVVSLKVRRLVSEGDYLAAAPLSRRVLICSILALAIGIIGGFYMAGLATN